MHDRRKRVGWALGLALSLAPSAVEAAPRIELESPRHHTKVRGEPARVDVEVAPTDARELQVEIDGQVRDTLLPWLEHTHVELEPGMYRIAVRGRDPVSGARLRSEPALVIVFPEPDRQLPQRRRHAWTAAIAFALAVLGGAGLRRRGH